VDSSVISGHWTISRKTRRKPTFSGAEHHNSSLEKYMLMWVIPPNTPKSGNGKDVRKMTVIRSFFSEKARLAEQAEQKLPGRMHR
jgi:hypothetical protein